MRCKAAGRALLLALGLLLPGAISPGRVLAQTHLVMGVTAVAEFTPVYVAAEKGYFTSQGLELTVQIVPNSSTLIPALLSDSVQVGGLPAPVFLQAIDQGLPIVCFAAGALTDPAQPVGAVVARPGSPINGPQDLAGKRLAVSGINSVMQILLRQWLTARHVDPASITFVEVPFPRMADALKTGSVDAVVEVEPFVSRMKSDGIGTVAIDYYRDVPAGTLSTAFCSSRSWAESHRPAIAALRAALKEANGFIAQDPGAAREILARTLKLPPAVAAGLPFSSSIFRLPLLPAQIAWWLDTLRAQGLVDKALTPSTVLLD